MCGIVGIISKHGNIPPLILKSLSELQNRGYDSAGISLLNHKIEYHKFISSNISAVDQLKQLTFDNTIHCGMGHNRWATHGTNTVLNAHPHLSNDQSFSIVHNGIIDNYLELKQSLSNFTFLSDTDTEVIINLIQYNYQGDVYDAISNTIQSLKGNYAFIVQSIHEPNKLFCVKKDLPLLVGVHDNICMVVSEESGFTNINEYIILENNDICVIELTNTIHLFHSNSYVKHNISTKQDYSLNNYKHWTLKEIHEQPTVVDTIIQKYIIHDVINLDFKMHRIDHIILLGCGTSYFAGLYGMYLLKKLKYFITVQTIDGAEFTEYDIPNQGNTLLIMISQSGETKDLYRCFSHKKNCKTMGIINVENSLIAREVDYCMYTCAGKEIGVASTKSFISQVICLSLFGMWYTYKYNYMDDLKKLSYDIKQTLLLEEHMKTINIDDHLFILGKGPGEYIAKEGSLKIKEISYIHSEGYSSSSIKHGPFALLNENFPVILLDLEEEHHDKVMCCYEEIKSRKSPIYLFNHSIIPINKSYGSLLGIIPLQLLAYYLSIKKGINPDIPKNLAKVVTVD